MLTCGSEPLARYAVPVTATRVQTRRTDSYGLDRNLRDADMSLRWALVTGYPQQDRAFHSERVFERSFSFQSISVLN